MATYDASLVNVALVAAERDPRGAVPAPAARYKMIGQDAVTSDRDTWVAFGAADVSGVQYSGPLATPLRNVRILGTW